MMTWRSWWRGFDTECSASVNGKWVGSFSDDTFLQGEIGFVVGNPSDESGTEVLFDNLRVSDPVRRATSAF